MSDVEYSESSYWDYISSLDQAEPRDTIRDLVKEAYPLFLTFLEELFYIEANLIFLNVVHEIAQQEIADNIMHGGISQMGVSKRVTAGMKKIKTFSKRPEIDRDIVRSDLRMLLPDYLVEVTQLYYFFKTFALVSELCRLSTSGVRVKILTAIDILEAESKIESEQDLLAVSSKYNISLDVGDMQQIVLFSKRYFDYLKVLTTTYNVGDYTFKGQLIDKDINATATL